MLKLQGQSRTLLENNLFQNLISILLVFSYKRPLALKLVAMGFTVLFIISGTNFIQSDFGDVIYGGLTVFNFIAMIVTLTLSLDKDLAANYLLTRHFIKNQDLAASDEEVAFFLREAEAEGFKSEFEHYLDSLGRKPLIKECLSKCLALQDKKNSGKIKA